MNHCKSYTLVIGNAIPKFNKYSFPKLEAYWEVDNMLPENMGDFSPVYFPKNLPKHFSIRRFASETGIYPFIEKVVDATSLGRKRVALGIRKEDVDFVNEKLNKYKGLWYDGCSFENYFSKDDYFHNLDVLTWLEWWMRWAVENCETPAIQAY